MFFITELVKLPDGTLRHFRGETETELDENIQEYLEQHFPETPQRG